MRRPMSIRLIAVVLCAQPALWWGNVAWAQVAPQPGAAYDPLGVGQAGAGAPGVAPGGMPGAFPTGGQMQQGTVVSPAQGGMQGSSLDYDLSQPLERRAGTFQAMPLQQAPVDEKVDPERYVCGPGDVLELNFWGLQNFRLRPTVDLEGRIFVARMGYFALQGKTLAQARQTLREAVARAYPRLSFDVALAEPRTFLVQVVDDVLRPGTYQARAVERVATLIARAGGAGPHASMRRIELRRRDGSTVPVDLLLFNQTGDVRYNPQLLEGDAIRVPFEQLVATVEGAVNRPGRYELVQGRDLTELVELAGGVAPGATLRLPVRVVRRTVEDRALQLTFPVAEGGRLPAIAIERDDIVTIPDVSELQPTITVIGAVKGATSADELTATRRLTYVRGETVLAILERVGGVSPLADFEGAYLIRDGKPVPIDLHALLVLRDLSADRGVQLGDTVVVPFRRRNILVQGAVMAPGTYPYNPAFAVDQYLSLAGGRSRNAQSLEDVKLVTPDGKMLENEPGLVVQPGSSLVVPERNFSRSEVVQIILSAASVLISGIAVLLAATK